MITAIMQRRLVLLQVNKDPKFQLEVEEGIRIAEGVAETWILLRFLDQVLLCLCLLSKEGWKLANEWVRRIVSELRGDEALNTRSHGSIDQGLLDLELPVPPNR